MTKHRWPQVLALCGLISAGCSSKEEVANDGCESCHRTESGGGIEAPHPLFALNCVDCHGGNGEGTTIAEAHVANPLGDRSIRELGAAELAAIDPNYLRFLNPGDPRAAAQSCGGQSSKAGSTGCHQGIVETVATSIHSTIAGIANVPRFDLGIKAERRPTVSVGAVSDPSFDASRDFTYESLAALELPAISGLGPDRAQTFAEHALVKACTGCHLGAPGAPGAPGRAGDHFASGCTACHMHYDQAALSQSDDPFAQRGQAGNPVRHVLTRAVPDEQCEHCHYTSGRIGIAYKGWRERTADENDFALRNAETNAEPIHGKPAGFYVIDEDTRDTIDLTPPDAHQALGLGCVDCHLSADGHGDGAIHPNMAREVTIECEDCHGNFSARAGEGGQLLTSGGAPISRLRREGDQVILTGALSGRDHVVPQVIDVRPSAAADAAHLARNHGELECYACHTAWMQNFYRVDRTLDLREMARDPITGQSSPGNVVSANTIATLGDLYLGQNPDGKIGTFMAESAFFSVVTSCDPRTSTGTCTMDREGLGFGEAIVTGWTGETTESRPGLHFRPLFAHTTANRGRVQPCERCHSRQFEVDPSRPRATFGQGNGRFFAPAGSSTAPVDLSRLVGDRGEPVVSMGHLLIAPVNGDRVQRAVNLKVSP